MRKPVFSKLAEGKDQEIFNFAPVPMALASRQGRFLHVNPAFCEFLGYAERALQGMTIRQVTHPDDWRVSSAAIRRVWSPQATDMLPLEKRYLRKGGKVVWGHTYARVLQDARGKKGVAIRAQGIRSEAGRVVAIVGTTRDVTARHETEIALRQAEAQYRTTINAMSDAIHAVDRDLRIDLANEAFMSRNRRLGLETNVVGRRVFDVFPFLPRKVKAEYAGVFRNGKVLRTEEITKTQPGGEEIVTETLKIPIHADGKVVRVLTVVRDITDRKLAEQSLQKAHDELELRVMERTAKLRALTVQLEQAEENERKRIAQVLHEELQQIIVGARMMLKGLRTGMARGNPQETIEQVDGVLIKAHQVTRALCLGLHPPILFDAGVGEGLEFLADDMKCNFGLTTTLELDETAEPPTPALRAFIFRAVRELLLNVVKHAGPTRAVVRMAPVDADSLLIEVKDEGVGFDPTRNRPTSFGLFSIRERVDFLGGQSKIVSAPGKGTCIQLTLPRR